MKRRAGHTTSVTIGGERLDLIASQRADGTLSEVFIRWSKQGTSSGGLIDGYAMALSAGLRHQVPLADLLRPGIDLLFPPNGHTDDPEIPRVRSVVDYLARRLAVDWLPYPERARLGVYTLSERVARAGPWIFGDAGTVREARRVRAARPAAQPRAGQQMGISAEMTRHDVIH